MTSKKGSTIFRTKRTSNFTTVSNEWIYNPELSAKAKGILLYLLSKPDDWETHTEDIVAHMNDGIDSIKSGIKELKKARHLVKRPKRDDHGKIIGWETLVFEYPFPEAENPLLDKTLAESPEADFPQVANPPTGNPTSGKPTDRESHKWQTHRQENPPLLNTERLNTDSLLNTEEPKKEECGAVAPPAIASDGILSKNHKTDVAVSSRADNELTSHPPSSAVPPSRRNQRKKRPKAEDVYQTLGDREKFEQLWQWYGGKCAAIPGAGIGDKVQAAEAWRDVIEANPDCMDDFRKGCALFFRNRTAGVPNLCRFIEGSAKHPTPYWKAALEAAAVIEGGKSGFGQEIELEAQSLTTIAPAPTNGKPNMYDQTRAALMKLGAVK